MSDNRIKLEGLEVKGYKSIDSRGQTVNFGDITILLGANGSGKSNLVSFFKMLYSIADKRMQLFIEQQGGTDAVLHYGPKHTESIEFTLHFGIAAENHDVISLYYAKLIYGMPDRLLFASELVKNSELSIDKSERPLITIDSAGRESDITSRDLPHFNVVNKGFKNIRVYQFHDTSDTAKIKTQSYTDDNRYLRSDAGNLAAFLYALSVNKKKYYDRIVRHISNVMPQFKDFELSPGANGTTIMLNWRDITGESLFGPHQISDGSLRFMALATLLLQPPEMIPNIIVIDEPELGLHPAAIAELAGMIKTASKNAQIIIATQSTRLVDEFSVNEIVAVERDEKNNSSIFKRLNENELNDWLSRYSLSELWEKNILGGRP